MPRTWIDISVPVRSKMVRWPGDPEIKIQRLLQIARGDVCNTTHLSFGAHSGTHMDAPLHFIATGQSIDKMPVDATVGPARVIEISDRQSIKPEELRHHRVRAGDRVLFKTRNSRHSWKNDRFDEDFVHVSKEAAKFLVDCKVRTVGIDYLSIGGYERDGVETHQILLGAGVWVIEGLNLAQVEAGRYDLICLPLKLLGAEEAPARAILRPRSGRI